MANVLLPPEPPGREREDVWKSVLFCIALEVIGCKPRHLGLEPLHTDGVRSQFVFCMVVILRCWAIEDEKGRGREPLPMTLYIRN